MTTIDKIISELEKFFESYAKVLNANADKGIIHFLKVFYTYPGYYIYLKVTEKNVIDTERATFGIVKKIEINPEVVYKFDQIKNTIKNAIKKA